jgi:ATP-dependent Zn protease
MNKRILNYLIIFTLTTFFLFILSSLVIKKTIKEISYYDLKEKIERGEIKELIIGDNFIFGVVSPTEFYKTNKEINVSFWQIAKDLNIATSQINNLKIKTQSRSNQDFILALIVNLIPVLLIIGLFWYMFSQAQKGAGQIFSFSRSSIKMYDPRKQKITFNDVAGLKEAKEELKEIIEFLKNPQKFLSLGARVPKGVLLVGPPGTGKTLLARATAAEANVPFFYISGSEFIELFVGIGASRIRDAFAVAKKSSPSILFIDEIDSIGRIRGVGITGAHEEREQTLNQLLAEMDGFEKETPLVVIAASVTGDTPVLVKKNNEIMLKPIKEIIDEYYLQNEDGIEKLCPDLEVLGFVGKKNKRGVYFRKAVWQKVRSVFRHKVKEIYIIEYLGGKIKATGNHSVFVRTKFGVVPKLVSELKPGDCLVDIPYQVNKDHKGKKRIYKAEFPHSFDLELNVFEPIYRKNLIKYFTYQFALNYAGKILQEKIIDIFSFHQANIEKWIREDSVSYEFSSNLYNHKIPEKIKLTPELMRIFGYYIAKGYSKNELNFCFNVKETDKINDLKHLMKKVFGLEPNTEKYNKPDTLDIIYHSEPLMEFFAYWCGINVHNKHIPSFLFEAPKKYFIEFLKGVFKGDSDMDKNDKLEITSVNKQLILELNWLSRMHGFKSYIYSFKVKKKEKSIKEVVVWKIIWDKTQNPFKDNQENKFNLKRPIVKRVIKVPYDDYVYDFCGCENEAFFGGESPILLHNTNRPDVLDPALLRPGRFDRKIFLDLPNINEREEILRLHLKDKKIGKIDIRQIAERTPGFSGADLANLCNEAAILAARRNKNQIDQQEIIDAIEKIILGPEKKSKVYSKKEKEIAAYHEAGHAIVAHYLPYSSPVQKISIIARGRAGGYTLKTPTEDKSFYFKKEFLDELSVMLGGYAAELIVFNDITTGASSDLKIATNLARELITSYGMSDKFGPVSLGRKQEIIYGYKEYLIEKDYSEKTAEEIDKEVFNILNYALERAKNVILQKRDKLDKIAKILIKQETIEKKQFERLIKEPKGSLNI